ncbi:MAG TPA: hypothetical protein VN923_13295, partial [Thermoanaerobaculia bacterium]|nr:hypothetical protein [Thermoanaerobaculia bacterium]
MVGSNRCRSVFVCVALACLVAMPAMAAPRVADLSVGGASLDWTARGSFETMKLTVSGPNGVIIERTFRAGEMPSLSIFDKAGQRLPDGAYNWELTAAAKVSAAVKRQLNQARRNGDLAAIEKLRQQGLLPEGGVQSGTFAIQNGSFVAGDGPAEQGNRATAAARITAADQVIPDDLIVQGSECVGLDCVNNESFGFDTIRLKENNTRIKFDDTSTSAGFPANDWQLTANDSASGGSSKFSIEDITGAKVPFTITAGAATNSIFADSTGRIGLRTSTPVLDLHINTSNTPAIRLEQNNSGGFTAQTWDIAGNEANFFVRDVTGGSKLSFRIRPGAPTSSVDISADGDVGVGTGSPEAKLHVFGANTADTFMCIGPNCDGSPGTESALNIAYAGATLGRGGALFNVRPDSGAVAPNPSLRFWTVDVERMIVTNTGSVGIGTSSPSSRLHVNGGDIRVSGGSFIDDGVTLNAPDYVFEPGYELMPLNDLDAFLKENRHLPGIPSASEIKKGGLNLS